MNQINKSDMPQLVLVCKRPRLGQGKQRLAQTLGQPAALTLAEALLDCALEDAAAWPGGLVIAPAAAEDCAWAARLLARPYRVIPQGDGNLGERLQGLDRQLRQRGDEALLYIGSDAPLLAPLHYRTAQQALARHQVVLSAADDGGVVLMGARVAWPELAALPWSTARLGEALRDACRQAGLDCGYIAPGYDIDHAADLARLYADLAEDARPARQRLRLRLQPWINPSANPPVRVSDVS